MSNRQRLPDRRASESFTLECAGLKYTATISRFQNGDLAEVFLTNGKAGSQSDSNARDAAITCSLALQYGAPLEVIRKALLRDSRGDPSTPLGSALDIIARAGQ
jgi:hypothetical protein